MICVERACDILRAFSPGEILELRDVAQRTQLNKVTALRILRTLVKKEMLQPVGRCGYRSLVQPAQAKRYRLGYAAQSHVVPFIRTVTGSIELAARADGFDLIVVNNEERRKAALRNADYLVRERVDVALEFQLIADIADAVAAKFASAGIPVIAIDNPQPGAIYFGADNYRAGHIAGSYLARWAAMNWMSVVDEVLLLEARQGGPVLQARMLGIADGLASLLSRTAEQAHLRYDVKGRFDQALETVRKHLRLSRARHILVGAVNDPCALGALEAFRELGMEERCAIVGQGAVLEARNEMRQPATRLVGSVAYFPETYGTRLMRLAGDILNHAPVPNAEFTQHRIVHSGNVNKLYANDLLLSPPRNPDDFQAVSFHSA